MNRYKTIIQSKLGWVGLFQTSLNWKNCFMIHWCFVCSKLHPSKEFGFTILGLSFIGKNKSLASLRFYDWGTPKACYFGFSFLFLPALSFRIGDGTTWKYIRCEEVYHWFWLRKQRSLSDTPF